jgi:hypothetical protein
LSSRVILRFSFNQGKRTSAKAVANQLRREFRAAVPDLLVKYGDEMYPELEAKLRAEITRDVKREISNVAQSYKRMIFGAGPGATGPRGAISGMSAQGGMGSRGAGIPALPAWPARSERYMNTPFKKANPQWFVGRTGYMKQMMAKGPVWEQLFGPVRVQIRRTRDLAANSSEASAGAANKMTTPGMGTTRAGLLQIKVAAFGDVYASMLRNYSSKSGLLGLVAERGGAELAYRLGGNTPAKHRPTLQPFLEYFLSRALPYAIEQRIARGLGANIRERAVDMNAGK